MRRKLALCVAALLLLGAGGPQPPPADKDQEALQGKWRSESTTLDGRELDGKNVWDVLGVDRDRITWFHNTRLGGGLGATSIIPYRYELHPATEPKGIDLVSTEGANREGRLGIYRLRRDTLTICLAPHGKGRPKAFESKDGTGHWLLRFKRIKPEKPEKRPP